MGILLDTFRFADIAYKAPKGTEPIFNGATFTPLVKGDDFGFIAEYDKRIVIAFRGTNSSLELWLENFDPYPLKDDQTIHDGFYDGWIQFKGDIDAKVVPVQKSILVTGHSRGAALATLCARHLAKNRGRQCSSITYGSPRVGNKVYRDQYNALPINTTRVVNGYDFAEEMPPHILGFRHVGNRYWLGQPRWHRIFRRIRDHLPKNYMEALEKSGK